MNERSISTDSFSRQLAGAVPNLLRYGQILLGNPHDAEDMAQEVVLRAWQKRHQYDPQKGSIAAWLRGFAVRVLREQRRQKMILWDDGYLDAVLDHWQENEEKEPLQALRLCLRSLSEQQRELLRLRYQGDVLIENLAQLLGKSVASVKTRLHRLRKSLLVCVERKLKE